MLLCALPVSAATIAEWNFNSAEDDADSATGTLHPSGGEGTFTSIGGTTSTFGSVGGGSTSDPALANNSQIRITRLPSLNGDNKSRAVEFTVTTTGFENITLSWDQYNSATASRYWRVQYTLDGFEWIDHTSIVNTNAANWTRHTAPFQAVPSLNNRSYLGLRIAPEYENTATGEGVWAYVAVKNGSNYSAAGSWWIDMVSIRGRRIGVTNSPPTVSSMADLVLPEESESEPIEFTVSDLESAPESLVVTVHSSNEEIAKLALDGTGMNRWVTVRSGIAGESSMTVRVTDEEGDYTETNFKVTVLPEQTEPPPPTNFFVLWNFNSGENDSDPVTGTLNAAVGQGEFSVIGTENHSFGSVGQSRTSDPAESDNTMLRLGSFPAQGTANQTAGLEIKVSTVGLRNIELFWDQYNSATASRFWRVQVTTNGVDFTDHILTTNSSSSVWSRVRRVSFREISGAENNPNFGVRLVSESGEGENYVAVGSSSAYSAAGTLWLDMVGLTGEAAPDEAPQITIGLSEGAQISWPRSTSDFILETKSEFPSDWSIVETSAAEIDQRFIVPVPTDETARFFRLRKKPPL